MTISEEILTIANQLANQGKKPTVALIKTKLKQAAPLPVIINTLKTWQHEPEFTALETSTRSKTRSKDNQSEQAKIEHAIEKAILPLQKDIIELKLLIKQLIENK